MKPLKRALLLTALAAPLTGFTFHYGAHEVFRTERQLLELLPSFSLNILTESKKQTVDLKKFAMEESDRQGVPRYLTLAVIDVESSWNPEAVLYEKEYDTGKGLSSFSLGLMQIMYPVWGKFCNKSATELLEPITNMTCGIKILKHLRSNYKTAKDIMLVYNAGPKGTSGKIPSANKYADRVLSKVGEYALKM